MRSILLAAVVGVATVSALAADAKTFRYSTTGDVLGLDPYINNEGPTNTMKSNIYEGLIHRTYDLSLEPALATEWEQVDPTHWRFKLREGVTYQNGNPFTADDVLASFDRIVDPDSEMSFAVSSIDRIEKLGEHEIEIVTKVPDPTLLQNLPLFWIMDKEWLEANDAMDVVRGTSAGTFANLNTNGTGPFRIVERVPDTRTVLEPNPDWWGEPTHNLTRAVFQPISNDATRVAALLSGEMDLIYPVPLQDIQRIESTAGVGVLQGPELRTIFLGFDQWRDESLDMPGSGKNPFKDVRVRKAFYQAIDIDAIERVVMRGAATATGLMIAPGIVGFQEDLNTRFPYDPEAAKALLAEAGYAEGFPVTFDCPNDRYVNDEAICTAIVPMLERVGIQVTPNFQTKSLHFDKIGGKQGNETSFYLLGWTPGTFDAFNMLQNIVTMRPEGHGTWNSGHYDNPRVEELTLLIQQETDQDKRNAMIHEAFQIHLDEVGHIPLHQQALAWGVAETVAEVKQRPQNDVDLRYVVMK